MTAPTPKIGEQVMKHMAKLAIEEATTFFAQKAREFATQIPAGTDGKRALEAFADAIDATNAKNDPQPKGGPHA